MRNSRSFQGLCLLAPTRALPWTHWGNSTPRPPVGISNDHWSLHIVPRHNSATPPTTSHWPAKLCYTPPKNLITRSTDEPPIKNPPKHLLPAGVLLRGVVLNLILLKFLFSTHGPVFPLPRALSLLFFWDKFLHVLFDIDNTHMADPYNIL